MVKIATKPLFDWAAHEALLAAHANALRVRTMAERYYRLARPAKKKIRLKDLQNATNRLLLLEAKIRKLERVQ